MSPPRRNCRSAAGLPLLGLAGILLSAAARGAGGEASVPQASGPPLDEIVVVGEKLHQMQQRIEQLEDRFNEVYNHLNTRREFDVACVSEAPMNSHIPRRRCEPTFVATAEREESLAFLEGHAAPPAQLVTQMRRDEYRRNMLEIVRRSPQLQRLLKEHAALQSQYQKVRQERFKGHWILFDE